MDSVRINIECACHVLYLESAGQQPTKYQECAPCMKIDFRYSTVITNLGLPHLRACEGRHGLLGLLMGRHDHESSSPRRIVDSGENNTVRYIPVPREYCGKIDSLVASLAEWTGETFRKAYLVRPKGRPST